MSKIVVLDLRSIGFMHQDFNRAFIHYLLLKYQQSKVVFCAETTYLQSFDLLFKNELRYESNSGFSSRVPGTAWRETRTFICTLLALIKLRRILRGARQAYILGSDPFTMSLTRVFARSFDCTIHHLFHGDLADHMLGTTPTNPIRLYFRFPTQLCKGVGQGHMIFLEQTILDKVSKMLSLLNTTSKVFPHPTTHFAPLLEPKNSTKTKSPTVFAFLGVARPDKGFDLFRDIAKQSCSASKTFHAIGMKSEEYSEQDFAGIVQGPFQAPASEAQYHAMIQATDFVIVPSDPQRYELVGSASLANAVLHLRPVIAIDSPLLQQLRAQFGTFGVFCTDASALATTIMQWSTPTEHQYQEWQVALARIRTSRLPESLAKTIDV
jgi:hypothetical protein